MKQTQATVGPNRRHRRRTSRLAAATTATALVSVVGATVLLLGSGGALRAQDTAAPRTGSPGPVTSPAAASPSAPPSPSAPTSPSSSPSAGVLPTTGTGVFSTAAGDGRVVGKGRDLRRYKVEVEQGTGLTPDDAAAEISAVLADPRSWTTDGTHSFQQVSEGPSDFEIKIATPDTVDRICGAAGAQTHGEVNCDAGSQVMVNLKRWVTGSPEFSGPVTEYRALIINHEVGHRIGHGHETCPGPGRPAPAMMQQIYGLKGCVPNAWPYDSHGNYLAGPKVR